MMFRILSVVLAISSAAAYGDKINVASNSTGVCGYEANCATGGYDGACVSIGNGCCPGGSVTAGLCPGIFPQSFPFLLSN